MKSALSLNMSRQALLTLAVREAWALPVLLPELCVADQGCRRCIEACPLGALRTGDGRVELDRARCESCGLCVAACPTGAIELPGFTPAELKAELEALLDPIASHLHPRGVLFLCRRNAATFDASTVAAVAGAEGWLPVVVPCVGALSPAVLLRCVALGAAAVGVAPCGGGCQLRQDGPVAERVEFCQELLVVLGVGADRVRLASLNDREPTAWELPATTPPIAPLERGPAGLVWHYPRSVAATVLALAEGAGARPDLLLTHPRSPLGVVELGADGCTGCAACVAACPTGALAVEGTSGPMALSFDATLCGGCALCLGRCPEAEREALRVRAAVDLQRLARGRTVLYRDETLRCQACGGPIAPAGLLARLEQVLGEGYGPLMATISRSCPSCRDGASVARSRSA